VHENRHFLLYQKCCYDADNHVHNALCVTLGSRCKMASNHRVTDLENIPVQISKDEALTPLSVVGPLFILSSLFNLSRTLLLILGAWRFSLHSVYSSFHNRLDLIREAAFYWLYFPNLSLFVSSL